MHIHRLLLAFAIAPWSALLSGQTLVGTYPTGRTALMEEFTAVNCGNCPAGHVVAAGLQATHGNNLVVVGIHAGGLAMPPGGQPDLRTTEGTALFNHWFLNATPKAVVGRDTYNGFTALASGNWAPAVDAVLLGSSPVNIGLASTFDNGANTLTVTVELYYTANSPGGNDHITVLLKEDHILAFQNDYGPNGQQWNYDHVNVLRGFLTPLWGDEVTTTTQGTLVTRTYSFTVPPDVNIANSSAVAFVGEYQGTVYQAGQVAADGGFTLALSAEHVANGAAAFPLPADNEVHIPLGDRAGGGVLEVRDMAGRLIVRQGVVAGQSVATIPTAQWASGAYLVRPADGSSAPHRVVVAHP